MLSHLSTYRGTLEGRVCLEEMVPAPKAGNLYDYIE
ncbi:hypothetical protein Holit_01416 [Hollandina sp. SP2]